MRKSVPPQDASDVRVIACCGGMIVVFGAERMSFEVLRVLTKRGASVHCLLNPWENQRIKALAESLGASWSVGRYGATLDRHTRNPLKILEMVFDTAVNSWGLARQALRFRATHIFVPGFTDLLRVSFAIPWLRLLGKKVILRLAEHPGPGKPYDRLLRFVIFPLVSELVVISEHSYRRMLERGAPERKLAIIRNHPLPSSPNNREASPLEIPRNRKLLLLVGQLIPQKAPELAVRAVSTLLREGHPIVLWLVGIEPLWPPEAVRLCDEIKESIDADGVGDAIRFVGKRRDVRELMRRSYGLIAPSMAEETFGNVLLESKAEGLPVVASDIGGYSEQVSDGITGFLFEPGNQEALENALRRLVKDDALRARMSEACREAMGRDDNDMTEAVFTERWLARFGVVARVAPRD